MPKKNCLQRPDAFQNFMHFSGFFEAMDCWYIYMANGKNQCSHINFNIKLNINIKINIDINIIQTLLASLYTLTPFPKISLKHQEDFGLPQCLPRHTSSPPSDHQLWLWVEQFQLAGCPRFLRGRFGQLSITGLGRSNELWRSCAGTLGSTAPGSHKLRWGK